MALGADLVLETVNAPGTATFNLAGTSTGRRTFVSGFGTGVQVYYTAHDGASWEIGYGTVTSGAPNTLSRDTVIENSLGTTAKINFTTSTNVYADIPSKRKPWASADNLQMLMGSRRVSQLVAATVVDDAPRFDQVRWTTRSTNVTGSAVASMAFSLPSDCARYRLEFQDLSPAASAAPYIRFSFDGGVSYASGATDYGYALNGATEVLASAAVVGVTSVSNVFGRIEFQATTGSHFCLTDTATVTTVLVRTYGSVRCSVAGAATHVLLGFVGQNIAAGRANLMGALT